MAYSNGTQMTKGYSFWCSKCAFSHPGECQPKVGPSLPKDDIPIGSEWIGQFPVNGIWTSNGFTYRVESIGTKFIKMVVVSSSFGDNIRYVPRSWFTPAGGPSPAGGGKMQRMVPK